MSTTPKEAPPLPSRDAFGCLMGGIMFLMGLIGPGILWLGTQYEPGEAERKHVPVLGTAFTAIWAIAVTATRIAGARTRALHRHLDRVGVRAAGEVISIKRTYVDESPSPADDLRTQVTGPGLMLFEARHVSEDVDRYQVGMHVPVDVDPHTNLYRAVG